MSDTTIPIPPLKPILFGSKQSARDAFENISTNNDILFGALVGLTANVETLAESGFSPEVLALKADKTDLEETIAALSDKADKADLEATGSAVQQAVVALSTKANIGHTAVPDADYQALVADTQIGFAALTATRTVTLPDVDAYPLGQVIFIADESGQCAEARRIRIVPGPGTGDTIAGLLDASNQPAAYELTDAYQGIGFRRGAANVWIVAR